MGISDHGTIYTYTEGHPKGRWVGGGSACSAHVPASALRMSSASPPLPPGLLPPRDDTPLLVGDTPFAGLPPSEVKVTLLSGAMVERPPCANEEKRTSRDPRPGLCSGLKTGLPPTLPTPQGGKSASETRGSL